MTSEEYYRSLLGHPLLPAGFNSADNNGDEVDGAGVNDPIRTQYLDSFTELTILLITEEMINAFETECPDYVVPGEVDTIIIPQEVEVLMIRGKAA